GGGGGRGGWGGGEEVGSEGKKGAQAPPQPAKALSGQRPFDGTGQSARGFQALPAGAPRGGSHGRGDRWAAFDCVRRGREPPARSKRHFGLVPERWLSSAEAV